MTKALHLETAHYEEKCLEIEKRRLNVTGVLKRSGVSRSGYNSWKRKPPSNREKRKEMLKESIRWIYEDSHQNYGAPRITQCLCGEGEKSPGKP